MPDPVVAYIQDVDPKQCEKDLQHLIQLLGGIERFVRPGDRVFIKPNLVAPFDHSRLYAFCSRHGDCLFQTGFAQLGELFSWWAVAPVVDDRGLDGRDELRLGYAAGRDGNHA